MRFRYDSEADALYIRFREGDIEETDEVFPDLILNVDNIGNMLGLEVLNASNKFGKKPLTLEIEMPGVAG